MSITNIALISANVGNVDMFPVHTPQDIPSNTLLQSHYFTSDNLPQRKHSFSPRLRAKIPKMLGWQLLLQRDLYIWLDSSIALSHPKSISWLIENLEDNDIAAFSHPFRNSIKEELEYMEVRMQTGDQYLIDRYDGEPIWQQVNEYLQDPDFVDNNLWACGILIYRKDVNVFNFLYEWYCHCCIYSVQDQLSFPYLLDKSGIRIATLPGNELDNPYFKWRDKRCNDQQTSR